MTAFWDWLGRVIMLVLAGMVTLSLIGALTSIPGGSLPAPIAPDRPAAWPMPGPREALPAPPEPRPETQPEPQATPQPQAASRPQTESVVLAPAPPEPVKPADWLESIFYVLLALAGIAAFAAVLLLRAVGHWRRSAEALERIAARS